MSLPPATSLQFEHEEVDSPQSIDCSRCGQKILSVYYEVAGNLLCERCKFEREALPEGTGIGRFGLSFIAGLGAAIAGSLVYFAVSALTGYEFGLIAIVVGIAVGKAVQWGSKGRGGWRYQLLAMGLTYLSIVATYVPQIFKGLVDAGQTETATNNDATSTSSAVAAASGTPAPAPTANEEAGGVGQVAWAIVLLGALVLASPFLAGFQNIIGILIISFGLFEAWKINKKTVEVVTGPFRLGERAPQQL